ncbi:hypothetical protein ABGT92_23835 [Streptomyces cinereoruber]|uniref:hypothetical protein n=1 Tax=Streptomyces cinereoruber TaxID=67260 RepID=UPI00345D59D9
MRRLITAAITATLLLLTGCGASEVEKQEACLDAIRARAEGDRAKPKACEEISDDDYNTLIIGEVIENTDLSDLLTPTSTP